MSSVPVVVPVMVPSGVKVFLRDSCETFVAERIGGDGGSDELRSLLCAGVISTEVPARGDSGLGLGLRAGLRVGMEGGVARAWGRAEEVERMAEVVVVERPRGRAAAFRALSISPSSGTRATRWTPFRYCVWRNQVDRAVTYV